MNEQDNQTIQMLLDRVNKGDEMMEKALIALSDKNKSEDIKMDKKDKEKWIIFFSLLIFSFLLISVFILSYFFGTYSTDYKNTNTNINENRNISEQNK